MNLIALLLRRGRIEQLPRVAAEFRRLDNARQGITVATATSAAPLTPDEVRALTGRLEQMTGGRIELDLQVDPSLLGGLVVRVGDRLIDGSVRGRLERLRNQLVCRRLLGDPRPWPSDPTRSPASSSPPSTRSMRVTETRSVGTVVEVGDGIAQIYGLADALSSEMLEFPGGVMGMALNLEEETVGAVILGESTRHQGRRHGQDHGPRRRGPRRPGAARPRRGPAGSPARRQGPDRGDRRAPRRAHRPGRHRPPGRRHAGPDRHQGHRRAHPDRPRPARAHHRRPPDRQDGHRDRHDHQPEGQGPRLHLRGDRPEALDGRQHGRRSSSSTARWITRSWSSPAPRTPPRSSTSPRTRA